MIDVREYARNLTEITGEYEFDFQRYIDLFNINEQTKMRQNYE